MKRPIIDSLLLECGFTAEGLPDYLSESELLGYAEHLPAEMQAEYLASLLLFLKIYEQLSANQRAEMLEELEDQLQKEFRRKRLEH
jgi:hypothetical protein